ncbi:3'-phosphoadenosine 5'-phosphosulfate sulfotransferase [Saxophila tyrrhenica]|uniref:FAD synthase n=1 Tax=Saxophila tyrrhenica TaxID=1690608 RepID=A0AAV9NYL6_9PEZI|nr:3'-phosphoadenosine 5'-phosphosulfate sulfotransferase [Saxophila tyrrhenica]
MLESAGASSDDNPHPGARSITDITSQQPPLPLPELCAQIHDRVHAFLNAEPKDDRVRAVQRQSRISLGVIEEALKRYSPAEISLSYNGGKDCLVLLLLYLCALHTHHHPHPSTYPSTLNSVYIIPPHPFPAVSSFVTATASTYHLTLTRLALPMREAFTAYLSSNPSIRAIFVGTRRTDPHGAELTHFDPTDRGWPEFMRVHPVIDWRYAEIWTFIRELGVEYCGLYDEGYTSLGGREDTHRNPALKEREGEGFRPAYELVEDGEERLGRDWGEGRP